MPPRKSKKSTKAASKAAPKTSADDEEQVPQSIPEVATQIVQDVVETVDTEMKEVAQAASNFVEKMTGDPSSTVAPESEAGPSNSESTSKAKQVVEEVVDAATQFVEKMDGIEPSSSSSKPTMTAEERLQKMDELRKRMRDSATANRAAVIRESTTTRQTAKDLQRLEKQRALAEILRSQARAEEEGREVDEERKKNWEYTIEENDAWEKRMKRKKGRGDFEFHDESDQARKKYKKDLDLLKPNLIAYNKQKEVALGLQPGTLVKNDGMEIVQASKEEQLAAAESLYRDANTLLYADNKPSEEAIDKMVEKLNKDIDKRNKFSRKRVNEGEPELITYINEKNRVFNKKIARYYDKYTEEIRASFERGTAL